MPPMAKPRKLKRKQKKQWYARNNIADPSLDTQGVRYSGNSGKWISNIWGRILNTLSNNAGRHAMEISKTIFSTASLGINPNPTYLYNGYKSALGATLEVAQASSTFTIAAANLFRTELFANPGSIVATAFTGNDTVPKYSKMDYYLEMDSDTYFVAIPFVVLLENGETVASTDSNTNNVATAVTAALPAQTRNIIYGPMVKSTSFRDNGNARYKAKMGFKVAALANIFAAHYRNTIMKEQNALVLQIGLSVRSAATKVVTVITTSVTGVTQIDPDLLGDV